MNSIRLNSLSIPGLYAASEGMHMAYDEKLANRIRQQFKKRYDVVEKKMFGGLCFMVSNHMCCGIAGNMLMARVGPDQYEACLNRQYVSEMDFTGRAMKGMIYVSPKGIASDQDLAEWLKICTAFVSSLPPK